MRSVLQSIKALFGQGLPCSSLPLGLFAVPALEKILDPPEPFWGLLFDFWHPQCSTPEQSCTQLCLNKQCNALMLADCAHSFIPEQAHFRLLWPSASRFVSWSWGMAGLHNYKGVDTSYFKGFYCFQRLLRGNYSIILMGLCLSYPWTVSKAGLDEAGSNLGQGKMSLPMSGGGRKWALRSLPILLSQNFFLR